MKKVPFMFLIPWLCCLLMSACSSEQQEVEDPFLLSFNVDLGDTVVEGEIDEAKNLILLNGIDDLSLITSVHYTLTDGATISPEPKTKLHHWNSKEDFVVSSLGYPGKVYTVIVTEKIPADTLAVSGDATIFPDEYYGKVIKHFFFDLKANNAAIGSMDTANDLFVDDDCDGLRISILGNANRPAHPSEGVIVSSYYQYLLKSIKRAQEARGNKELIIFASKKLEGENSFPSWVKDANGIIPEEYGAMLVDYILFMKENGVFIDVLGVDNEANFNEGEITPEKHAEVVAYLKKQAIEKGFTMPLIIGPERYEPMGDVPSCWLKRFFDANCGNTLDIYGTHYYPSHRYFDKLEYELSLIGDRPFWATEPHWSSPQAAPDVLHHAETAICTLWDQTDLGLDAFMWWAYQREGNLRGCLMRDVSVPIHGARPIRMTDQDGESTLTTGKLQTRAFRKGDILHVYLINMCLEADLDDAVSYDDYKIGLDSESIDGEVSFVQWTDDSVVEGTASIATKLTDKMVMLNLPKRSITHLQFRLAKQML